MFVRRVIEFIFSSPITLVASVVSVGCVGFLVVNLVSDIGESKSVSSLSSVRSDGSAENEIKPSAKKLPADAQSTGKTFNASSVERSESHENAGYNENGVGENQSVKYSNRSDNKQSPSKHKKVLTEKVKVSNKALSNVQLQSSGVKDKNDESDGLNQSLPNLPTSFSGFTDGATNVDVAPVGTSPINNTETSIDISDINNTSDIDTISTDLGDVETADSNTESSDTNTKLSSPSPSPSPEPEPEPEPSPPVTVDPEREIKTDIDETQSVSCIPIVPDGPACMCTYTTSTVGRRSIIEVVDGC